MSELLFVNNMGGGILLFLILFGIAYSILSDFKDPNMKLIWIIIILFGQVIGPLVYLILGKGTKTTTS